MTRGRERGACTMPRCRCRPNASLPCSLTMKFRLLFRMRGKWPRRVERQRRQYRHDLLVEIILSSQACCVSFQSSLCRNTHAGLGELREQFFIQEPVLLTNQFRNARLQLGEYTSLAGIYSPAPAPALRAPFAASNRRPGSRKTHRDWCRLYTGSAGARAAEHCCPCPAPAHVC